MSATDCDGVKGAIDKYPHWPYGDMLRGDNDPAPAATWDALSEWALESKGEGYTFTGRSDVPCVTGDVPAGFDVSIEHSDIPAGVSRLTLNGVAFVPESADLIPRDKLVAWLESEAESFYMDGTLMGNAQSAVLSTAAKAIKAGNPWEGQ